jgi:hypothetical protein
MITWTTRQKPGPAALRARTCVFLCTNMCICTKSLSARLHVWCTQKSHVHKNKRRIPVCGIMFCLNARALCKRVYWLVHRNSHDSIAGFQSECAQGFFCFLNLNKDVQWRKLDQEQIRDIMWKWNKMFSLGRERQKHSLILSHCPAASVLLLLSFLLWSWVRGISRYIPTSQNKPNHLSRRQVACVLIHAQRHTNTRQSSSLLCVYPCS